MITTVVFTANSKAGNLARIALAARRLGFRSVKQAKLRSDRPDFDKIQLDLESDYLIQVNDLNSIREIVPTVVQIQSVGAEKGQVAAKRTRQQPASAVVTGDAKEIAGRFGKQMVASFPNIRPIIKQLNDELDSEIRDDVMLKLGKGIGRWRYKKRYAHGAKLPLDKTLQRLAWPALGEFVEISKEEMRVHVHNCQHGSQTADTPDCHFITGFLQGFLGEMTHFRAVDVVQAGKSTGGGSCVFEVRPK